MTKRRREDQEGSALIFALIKGHAANVPQEAKPKTPLDHINEMRKTRGFPNIAR